MFKTFTAWETKRRRNRWTLYLGAMGRTMPGRTKYLRVDKLNVDFNTIRSWSL